MTNVTLAFQLTFANASFYAKKICKLYAAGILTLLIMLFLYVNY